VEEHYLPAARRYRALVVGGLARARSVAAWEAAVRAHWGEVRIEEVTAEPAIGGLRFRAQVHLGGLRPEDVAVQVYADPRDGAAPETAPLGECSSENGATLYEGGLPTQRPARDFTLRLLPAHPDARQPLDLPLVLWQR
jgi:starch phosphorylase